MNVVRLARNVPLMADPGRHSGQCYPGTMSSETHMTDSASQRPRAGLPSPGAAPGTFWYR